MNFNYSIQHRFKQELAMFFQTVLNTWQVESIGDFVIGVIKAESSRERQIAKHTIGGELIESARRRLRRFKANEKLTLDKLNSCFVRLTYWVVGAMLINLRTSDQLYLLVDETKLGDRLGALVVGIAWESRCIPLAWRVYKANDAEAYPEEGQVEIIRNMLVCVKEGLSWCDCRQKVVVMADRGIGVSSNLCQAVDELGFSYLFRVTNQCTIKTPTGVHRIASMVKEGETWGASGLIFPSVGDTPGHARAIWGKGYDEPWALVTNDPSLNGPEYALRNWQEQSFRDLKSHGWQWEASRTLFPLYMARFMLILVIAYAWTVALGGQAVKADRAHPLQRHPDGHIRRHRSLFREGLDFFIEVVARENKYFRLEFIPDHRLRAPC
jgi:hypothetical protein